MSCKKTGGSAVLKRQRSSKRALVRFLYFASFVLNRMPIAGDKLPAFLRRIVPGEAYFVLVISLNTLWTIILSIYVSRMPAPLRP